MNHETHWISIAKYDAMLVDDIYRTEITMKTYNIMSPAQGDSAYYIDMINIWQGVPLLRWSSGPV